MLTKQNFNTNLNRLGNLGLDVRPKSIFNHRFNKTACTQAFNSCKSPKSTVLHATKRQRLYFCNISISTWLQLEVETHISSANHKTPKIVLSVLDWINRCFIFIYLAHVRWSKVINSRNSTLQLGGYLDGPLLVPREHRTPKSILGIICQFNYLFIRAEHHNRQYRSKCLPGNQVQLS